MPTPVPPLPAPPDPVPAAAPAPQPRRRRTERNQALYGQPAPTPPPDPVPDAAPAPQPRRRRTERNQALYSQPIPEPQAAPEPQAVPEPQAAPEPQPTPEPQPAPKEQRSRTRSLAQSALLAVGLVLFGVWQAGRWLVSAAGRVIPWLREQCLRLIGRRDAKAAKSTVYQYSGFVPPSGNGGRKGLRGRFAFTPRTAALCGLAVVMAISLVNVVDYYRDLLAAKSASAALREAYYAELAAQTPTPTPAPTPAPTSAPAPTRAPRATATPSPTPAVVLQRMAYPLNPLSSIRSQFLKLRRQNEDIVGWLTIPDVLDEGVVQRDNSYYLRRDYRGYHNDNGAIFMEQAIALDRGRPYTLILYGHNMRTGAMFGCLRNFENIYFYRKNAFVTFDTAYEDGQYVIFAVGTLSQQKRDRNYVDVSRLLSSRVSWREEVIASLTRNSVINSLVGVNADDQILLLVTCVEDEEERRYVAARRIRDGEAKERLQELAEKSRAK